MLKRIGLLALFLLGGLAVPAVKADEFTGRPLILAVGIDKYQDQQIKPRQHAEADAKALVDLFLAKESLGADKERVKLLLGSGPIAGADYTEKATKDNILKALQWMDKSAKKDDLVILAIFGEGAPVGERTCYFAVDSTFKDRAKDAVASGDIEHAIDDLKSERFVAMVDVNFYGFDIGKEKLPDLNTAAIFRVFLSAGDDAKDSDKRSSRVLFFAGAPSKASLDLDKHGIFAQALLDGLRGKADAEGYEGDGNIFVSELAKYMRKHLGDLARANGKTKEQKEQKAGTVEAQISDFVVAYNPAARKISTDRLAKFDALAKDKNLDKKLAEEGHNLLVRMPKLEAQQSLRKAYQKLTDGKLDLEAFNAERKEIMEGTLLSEKDAGKYAVTVMHAANLVRKSYYKEVPKAPLVGHAIDGLYKNVEEKIPSDLQQRLDKVKDMTDVELLRLLTDARQNLGKREDLAKGQDITASLDAMLAKLDKHTGYIPPEVVERFRTDTSGKFRGIGVQIRRNEARDELQVVTPIYNSPSHKAGIKAGDIITGIVVDPESKDIVPTKGMTTEDAVKIIKGKPGTRVKLIIDREGSDKPLEFTLIRKDIEVESVLGYKRTAKDTWNYVIDPDNKICYVRLTQFSEDTFPELEKVMKKLSKEGVKGFILDLRFNPGGLLDSAIKISDLFIDDGLIVTIRHRDGTETSYVGRSDGSYTTFPMVCLINGGSASASEIVSACLQDHGRAIIMGSRSFGKGSVQTIHPFDNQSIVKLTTATFWRPSGRNLNKSSTKGRDEDEWGVTPNKGFEIKLSKKEENDLFDHQRESEVIRGSPLPPTPTTEAKDEFRDRQLEMALEYLRGQIKTASRKNPARDVDDR
jgi:carboxyl-terminal processing protease